MHQHTYSRGTKNRLTQRDDVDLVSSQLEENGTTARQFFESLINILVQQINSLELNGLIYRLRHVVSSWFDNFQKQTLIIQD